VLTAQPDTETRAKKNLARAELRASTTYVEVPDQMPTGMPVGCRKWDDPQIVIERRVKRDVVLQARLKELASKRMRFGSSASDGNV
jgi:hypothetical protein